jgi:hypothetical protein
MLDLHKNFPVITVTEAQGKKMVKQKILLNKGEIIELIGSFHMEID